MYQKRHTTGGTGAIILSGGAPLPRPLKNAKNLSAEGVFTDTEFKLASTGLRYVIDPDWKISASASYSDTWRRFAENDVIVTNAAGDYLGAIYDNAGHDRFFQTQVMVEGHLATGPVNHQLIFGYSWQKMTETYLVDNVYADFGTGNIYQTNNERYVSPFTDIDTTKAFNVTQGAAFISDTIDFGERWSAVIGVRRTDYKQTNFDTSGRVVSQYQKSPFTPVAALLFKPVKDTTIYASYVESLEQGSTVASQYENRGELLKPLASKQYELGIKSEHTNWNATAAVFRIERGAAYANDANYYVQDGITRYQGVEVAGSYRPVPNLVLGGTMMWLEASYEKTALGDVLNGRRPAGAPKFVAAGYASYDVPQIEGLKLGVDAKYTEGVVTYYYSGTDSIALPSYIVANAHVDYHMKVAGNAVTLSAALNNIANRHYFYGSSVAFVGAPRTFVLGASLAF